MRAVLDDLLSKLDNGGFAQNEQLWSDALGAIGIQIPNLGLKGAVYAYPNFYSDTLQSVGGGMPSPI